MLRAATATRSPRAQIIYEWDPYNAVIISEHAGEVKYHELKENVTYREIDDEQTGHIQKVVIDSRDRTLAPTLEVHEQEGEGWRRTSSRPGRTSSSTTARRSRPAPCWRASRATSARPATSPGGLPRVTELFEARSPNDPAVVSEIDGIVSFGAQKRGSREVIVTSHDGKDIRKYPISLGKHVLVQENDVVRAGERLSDGAIDPHDVLRIKGVGAVQEYLVNEIQEVYRIQGVKINDKHIEIIVRQMMQKVRDRRLRRHEVPRRGLRRQAEVRGGERRPPRQGPHRQQGGFEVQERPARRQEEGPGDERRSSQEGEEGDRVPRRGAGDVGARPAGHHVGVPVDGELDFGRVVPGDDEGPHRCGDRREAGQPARPEGKRHHGPSDPCRDRA